MNRIGLHITVIAFVVTLSLALCATVLIRSPRWDSLIVFIFMAGTIGGVANNIRRLSRLPIEPSASIEPRLEFLMLLQIYLSPLIGGIFACVLYVLFMSGIVQGALFPRFNMAVEYTTTADFASASLPVQNVDAAKALVWAFIAGFAEACVPNLLERVTRETERVELDASSGTTVTRSVTPAASTRELIPAIPVTTPKADTRRDASKPTGGRNADKTDAQSTKKSRKPKKKGKSRST
ncbi:MAG: hypothetical protein AAF432_02800 [Planctomycetota bacterium]